MTFAKVAQIAGVSNATVSRVVNRQGGVSPETVLAVEAVMKQLGFVPPERRRGPKPNVKRATKAQRIALVVSGGDASHANSRSGFVLLLQGIEAALAKHDLHLNLVFASNPEKVPPILQNDPPDGLLMMRDIPLGEADEFYRKIPVVWLMANEAPPQWGDQVMPNNETIGRVAAKYLMDRGHKRLAFLNLRHGVWHFDLRAEAFRAAATAAGAHVELLGEPRSSRERSAVPDGQDAGRAAELIQKLQSLSQPPTGIFVAEDSQMRYFHTVMMERQFPLGHGIDVISCNRELPYLAGLTPQSATIDIRFQLIGQVGVERLLWRMDNAEIAGRVITLVDPELAE